MSNTQQWPMFRGNPSHTGSLGNNKSLSTPKLLWRFSTGGIVESTPTVIDGLVYVGTFADHLYALDANTGESIWTFKVNGLVRASPSVVDGLVYFGGRKLMVNINVTGDGPCTRK